MAYALITGAAKGIGRALAEELASRGYQLILADRDKEQLEATTARLIRDYEIVVRAITLDLSDRNAAEYIYRQTTYYHPHLQIVINNAGYGLNGDFEKLGLEQQLNIIDVNVKAQLRIAHWFLPVLKARPSAYLLNVGSTTSYQSVPYLSIYAASKAFVLSFTRSLRQELKGSPVSVSCLSPGSTDTDFVNRAGMQLHTRKIADRFNMSPQRVARIAVRGLFKKRAEIIPGFINQLNAVLPKFFPKTVTERIAANIYRPRVSPDPAPVSTPVLTSP
ncbi:SDR family NAD(P)-dependent oxidoreductase [Niabella beijingensis]|uniref:SDR family NAD(P)-dependent oxidoreductase n=1 Tax=Niabella beijingensis TaxID=2872700 RepID=UPI001CBFFB95|nr:SDR family oxidoreductase [Niabella beijingensis]MBZ4191150.1 SDR family oxidoreductase [Niabella beijingensis]